jgi:cytosine/adenosine deaminase-related metal-dependent hydrolase
MVTKVELQEMAKAGRTAIEYRLLSVLILPRALTDADEEELSALKDLMSRYDALMAVCLEKPETPEAANDADGGKEG